MEEWPVTTAGCHLVTSETAKSTGRDLQIEQKLLVAQMALWWEHKVEGTFENMQGKTEGELRSSFQEILGRKGIQHSLALLLDGYMCADLFFDMQTD